MIRKILFLNLIFTCYCVFAQSIKLKESQYAAYIQFMLGGELEYRLNNGRVDLLTSEYAIEIERASKWKNSIGQSAWYALNTNKKPAVILLMEKRSDYKYAIQLRSTIEYLNPENDIHLWAFPFDFMYLIVKNSPMAHKYMK